MCYLSLFARSVIFNKMQIQEKSFSKRPGQKCFFEKINNTEKSLVTLTDGKKKTQN